MKKRVILLVAMVLAIGTIAACGRTKAKAEAHTNEELLAFAEEALEEKYGEDFVLDTGTLTMGGEKESGRVSGYAYVKNREEERCYFIASEPGRLKDNYSITPYREPIAELIQEEMAGLYLEGTYEVDYPAEEKTLGKDLDPSKVLHDGKCEIYYEGTVAEGTTPPNCIPVLRAWMDYLYGCSHKWYFELKEEGTGQKLFTLDPGDNGFSSSGEWSDELLIRYIRSCSGRWEEELQVQYVRTDGYPETTGFPLVFLIEDPAELAAYISENKDILEYCDFPDIAAGYDEAWFAEHKLLMVVLEEPSGSIAHEVISFTDEELRIKRILPEVGTDDIAVWHILVETEEAFTKTMAEELPVVFEDENVL